MTAWLATHDSKSFPGLRHAHRDARVGVAFVWGVVFAALLWLVGCNEPPEPPARPCMSHEERVEYWLCVGPNSGRERHCKHKVCDPIPPEARSN